MKKLLLALLLSITPAFGQGVVGPPYQPICNAVAQGAIVTGSSIQYVTPIAGKFIYICGWHVTTSAASGTSTFQISTGTTGTCPATAMTPAFSLSNTAPSADHIDFAGFATPLGQNVCVTAGGIGPNQVLIYYGQY